MFTEYCWFLAAMTIPDCNSDFKVELSKNLVNKCSDNFVSNHERFKIFPSRHTSGLLSLITLKVLEDIVTCRLSPPPPERDSEGSSGSSPAGL